MFGKWHTGFRSMRHLPSSRGFATSVGSLNSGGAYQGPAHALRWQDAGPLVHDESLTHPPAGCDVYASSSVEPTSTCGEACYAALPMCTPSAFLNGTQMPCNAGPSPLFFNLSSAGECCGQCASTPGCTHWVYQPAGNPDADASGPCHVKFGAVDPSCPKPHAGATSGLAPPAPPANTTCTDEYSTDLWGQLAVQAVERHDPTTAPIFVHLCFEAVHTPYDPVPAKPSALSTYQGMLWRADVYVGALVGALDAKGMLNDSLILYSSDKCRTGSRPPEPV